jgi:metal-responsive CopG/Arc/MetJ family transcriptional regulator
MDDWWGLSAMPTQQLLVRLPDELVQRFKRHVAARGRSAFVQQLLEQALPAEDSDDDPLYLAAMDVERDEKLAAEMAEWDVTIGDGLEYVP